MSKVAMESGSINLSVYHSYRSFMAQFYEEVALTVLNHRQEPQTE